MKRLVVFILFMLICNLAVAGKIDVIKSEITSDPLARTYSAMTDLQVANDMNTVYRTTNKSSLTGSQVLNAIDKSEFNSKTVEQKQQVWDIIHIGNINPFGIEADLFQDIFGLSNTITSLQALRLNNVSRGVELGIGIVRENNVTEARLQ